MSREIDGPVSAKNASGERVMAAALKKQATDPRVVVHLIPMPGGKGAKSEAPPPPPARTTPRPKKGNKRKRPTSSVPESLKDCTWSSIRSTS